MLELSAKIKAYACLNSLLECYDFMQFILLLCVHQSKTLGTTNIHPKCWIFFSLFRKSLFLLLDLEIWGCSKTLAPLLYLFSNFGT
jgi:hypothetical protein